MPLNKASSLYIHIPFCKKKCGYCDFYSSVDNTLHNKYVTALNHEIELRSHDLSPNIDTIYFGGGTPSLLSPDLIESVLNKIQSLSTVNKNAEITLECNPTSISLPKAEELLKVGINRISLGIQSFDDNDLKVLERIHNSSKALESYSDLQTAGFNNIGIDLIFAIPGQKISVFEHNLKKALDLKVKHLSVYGLSIEKDTPMFNKGYDIDIESYRECFLLAHKLLTDANYQHYELSNYCQEGYSSRHNKNYWKEHNYIGLGPSAHSKNGNIRSANISNVNQYINNITSNNKSPEFTETLTEKEVLEEYIMLSLRTSRGLNIKYLQDNYGYDLLKTKSLFIQEVLDKGLMLIEKDQMFLTISGMCIADSIIVELLD